MQTVSKRKSVLEWIKNPDVEVHATGWPAVAVAACIVVAIFQGLYSFVLFVLH